MKEELQNDLSYKWKRNAWTSSDKWETNQGLHDHTSIWYIYIYILLKWKYVYLVRRRPRRGSGGRRAKRLDSDVLFVNNLHHCIIGHCAFIGCLQYSWGSVGTSTMSWYCSFSALISLTFHRLFLCETRHRRGSLGGLPWDYTAPGKCCQLTVLSHRAQWCAEAFRSLIQVSCKNKNVSLFEDGRAHWW